MRLRFVVVLAVSVLLVGACGGSSGNDSASSGGHDMDSMDTEGVVPGQAAEALRPRERSS